MVHGVWRVTARICTPDEDVEVNQVLVDENVAEYVEEDLQSRVSSNEAFECTCLSGSVHDCINSA